VRIKSDYREENLYPLWETFCKSKSWSTDLRLQGLNAGKLNLFEGPDFQGAEFELDGKIYCGDVEIHRTTNDWYHHHHHLDRRYNFVRLHLVWHQQSEISILTSDEQTVNTLDIKKLSGCFGYHERPAVCKISDFSSETLGEKLKVLSLKRLSYKTTCVKNLVKSNSYDQVIFLLFMRLLGSPNNVKNFEYLASLLPWEEMNKMKKDFQFSSDYWIQFYFHLSGLKSMKSKLKDKSEYISYAKLIKKTSPISLLNWQRSGQRPKNNPVYHLTILASWFSQFPYESLYFTLKNIIIQRLSATKLISNLHEAFSPCFSKQKDPNTTELDTESMPKWGKAIITEIIGNVIIPFFYWEASVNSSFGFQKYLEEFFFALPQLNQYAKLDKLRRLSSTNSPFDKKFFINQGLLYLHQHYCIKEGCHICPLTGQLKDIDKNL
jgi:hypothetical protein